MGTEKRKGCGVQEEVERLVHLLLDIRTQLGELKITD
jgi:hypothetical protein